MDVLGCMMMRDRFAIAREQAELRELAGMAHDRAERVEHTRFLRARLEDVTMRIESLAIEAEIEAAALGEGYTEVAGVLVVGVWGHRRTDPMQDARVRRMQLVAERDRLRAMIVLHSSGPLC